MYQINGLYTITIGGVQVFEGANPSAGIPNGTQITADWLNDVQGELLSILAAADITMEVGTRNQVLTALNALFATSSSLAAAEAARPTFSQLFESYPLNASLTGTSVIASASFTPPRTGQVLLSGNAQSTDGLMTAFYLSGSGYSVIGGRAAVTPGALGTVNYLLSVTAGVPVTLDLTLTNSDSAGLVIGGTALFLPTV